MEQSKETLDVRHGRSSRWLWLVLPANIAYGPISTLITLYILSLGGNVLDVSYAITLASAVAIPAAFFWGKISDTFNNRKGQILISYVGLSASLFGLLFAKSVLGAVLIYGALSFVIAANAAPLSLLVIEHSPKKKWASIFAKLQVVSGIGAVVGYVIAAVVTSFVHLDDLILVMAVISLGSILLTARLLYKPLIKLKRETFVQDSFAFMARLVIYPVIFIVVPSLSALHSVFSPRSGSAKRTGMQVLYAASFVFFLGSGLFNTAYPAGLGQSGLPESLVFVTFLISQVVQTATFNYSSWFLKKSRTRLLVESVLVRGICYILIGMLFFWIVGAGSDFFSLNIVFYLVASGIAYSIYYTLANTMVFESISTMDRGSALGIYTALTGVGTLAGAFLAGYASYYLGYWFTFLLAGALLLLSASIFKRLPAMAKS